MNSACQYFPLAPWWSCQIFERPIWGRGSLPPSQRSALGGLRAPLPSWSAKAWVGGRDAVEPRRRAISSQKNLFILCSGKHFGEEKSPSLERETGVLHLHVRAKDVISQLVWGRPHYAATCDHSWRKVDGQVNALGKKLCSNQREQENSGCLSQKQNPTRPDNQKHSKYNIRHSMLQNWIKTTASEYKLTSGTFLLHNDHV